MKESGVVFDAVLDAARALTPAERVRLAEQLWEEMLSEDRAEIEAEWRAEVARRSAAYHRGEVTTSTWEEVKQFARERAGLND